MTDRPEPAVEHEGWEQHTVERDGTTIAYYRRPGPDPALVAVHGLTAWGPDLFESSTALGDHDVVIMDVRGHGRSDAPDSGYDLGTAAADLQAVIGDAGVEEPILLGHSLGGGIVTTHAARRPAGAVVAIDPVGLLGSGDDENGDADDADGADDSGGDSEWVPRLIEEGRTALEAGEADDAEPGAAYADHRVRRFASGASDDPTDRYEAIDAPVLVLRADVPEAERERDESLLTAFRDSRVVYVDEAGHTIHRDRPERTADLLRSFLAEHG